MPIAWPRSVSSAWASSCCRRRNQKSDWGGVLTPAQIEYAVRDVTVLPPLKEKLAAAVTKAGLDPVAGLEFDIVPVTVAMGLAGVGIDRNAWMTLLINVESRHRNFEKLLLKPLA